MIQYVTRRLLAAIPVLLVVSFLIFVLIDLAPGDTARSLAGENPTDEQIQAVRESLGLDDPLLVRYADWLKGVITGDLGQSFVNRQSVTELIGSRLAVTLSLVTISMTLAVVLGVGAGILAAHRIDGLVDRTVNLVASAGIAIPSFWFGLLLVVVFAVNNQWLPPVGYIDFMESPIEWFRHLILPAIALSLLPMSELALQMRASLADVLRRDYVLNAEAKGLTGASVLLKHALKNATVPVVTVFGYRFAQVLGGTVTIETVFSLPGLGSLAVESVLGRNIPVLLGLVVLTTAIVLIVNLVVDISYGYFNPKVRV